MAILPLCFKALIVGAILTQASFAWQNYSNDEHSLLIERKKRLLGVYGTYSKAQSDANLNITGFEPQAHYLDEKQFSFGIAFGYLLDSNHRLLMHLEHHLKKNGFSYQLLTLGYAFTLQIPNVQDWLLLLGVNAGITFGQFDNGSFVINGNAVEKLSYTGLTYGVKGGLIYVLAKGELEFGLQARRLNFGKESGVVGINGNVSNVNLDLSKTHSISGYLGYNFFF